MAIRNTDDVIVQAVVGLPFPQCRITEGGTRQRRRGNPVVTATAGRHAMDRDCVVGITRATGMDAGPRAIGGQEVRRRSS
jgi:hypothetical protein